MRQALQKGLSKSWQRCGVANVHTGRRYAKIKQFTPVVDYQMQFEAVKPARRAFANGSNIFENPVAFYALIFANRYFCGVNESNSRAFSETNQF